jgi:hypothetical protein
MPGIRDFQQASFLLDLVIGRLATGAVPDDPVAFILHYRLSEQEAEEIMDEVGRIASDVQHGSRVTAKDAVRRVLDVHPAPADVSPELFAADAMRAWAPVTWEKIKNR